MDELRELDWRLDVRVATPADVPAIRTVAYETWPATYTGLRPPRGIRSGLADWWSPATVEESVANGRDIVATVDGVVVGVARHGAFDATWSPRPEWTGAPVLWCLYLLPSWHGFGLGKRLYWAAVDACAPLAAASESRARLILDCVEGNEPASTFYLRQGMRRVAREDGDDVLPPFWWYELPADLADPAAPTG